ncbi:MAG: type II toxin-antitoxin system VapC family toxin, partial [Paracoccaceae bacterium]
MVAVLLDTHALAWSLAIDPKLSRKAQRAIELADPVGVSPISIYEIGQKVKLGKWPAMVRFTEGMSDMLLDLGVVFAPLTEDISLSAGLLDWSHRDPFDRMIAATALAFDMTLISA